MSQNKLIILCASYFDRLGHPIFAKKIMAELTEHFEGKIEIRGIATSTNNATDVSTCHVIPIKVVFGSISNIKSRSDFIQTYGKIGLLINWSVRLVALTHFYWINFRNLKFKVTVIDLECEPIQAALAILFIRKYPIFRGGFVIHSMPKNFKSYMMKIYKYISVKALKVLLLHSQRRVILMSSAAIESAVNNGLKREQCILGGWGYDLSPGHGSKLDKLYDEKIVVLAFGVMRKDKRIEQLVELFLDLDDPNLLLRVVGKSIDVNLSLLRRRIRERNSQTIIEISDRFVEEEEIAGLFASCHMVVLSHSTGFESMSGPMFLAIQYERPILCFSDHTVAALVHESGAGMVLRFEDEASTIIDAIRRLRYWSYNQAALERFTWRAIANRMVSW